MRSSRFWSGAAILCGMLAVVWIVAQRIVPTKEYDFGIYISVAERLRAGDRLYADVWDNKDPLFYWVLAIGRSIGPAGDIAVEAMWLVIACTSAGLIAHRAGASTGMAVAVCSLAAPLLLTGGLYSPGATHLPGVALTLAVIAASMWPRPVLAGLLISGAVLLKLVIAPLTLVVALVVLARQRSWGYAVRMVAGLMAGLAFFATVLSLRGELSPFLRAQVLNARYAQNTVLIDQSNEIGDHLRRGLGGIGAVLTLAFALIVLGSWVLDQRNAAPGPTPTGLIRELAGVSLLAALSILAVTGMWPHHAQVLYVSGILCVVLIAVHLDRIARPLVVSTVLVLGVSVLLSGSLLPHPTDERTLTQRWAALKESSPETIALLQAAPGGQYARLGMHDDLGHAEGLGAWTLACPRFHQYPWDAPDVLAAALDCAIGQPYLILTDSIRPRGGWMTSDAWNDFAASAEELIREQYVCTPYPGGRVCQLTAQG